MPASNPAVPVGEKSVMVRMPIELATWATAQARRPAGLQAAIAAALRSKSRAVKSRPAAKRGQPALRRKAAR